jgi:small subunit ribosomal protein S24e
MYTQLTMEIEILEQEDNPLLHRTEVKFEIKHDEETPSRLSVRDSLAAKLDKDSEEVVVHNLDTKFGMRQTVGRAKAYDSPEEAAEVEHEHMLERNKIGEDDADAEAEEAE